MDMFKMLSIEGFVEYYLHYCARMDEVSKEKRKLKRDGEMDKAKAYVQESLNLIRELHFVEKKYSLMFTLSELQEALEAYPEGSRERMAVEIILGKKQSMLKNLNECFGF